MLVATKSKLQAGNLFSFTSQDFEISSEQCYGTKLQPILQRKIQKHTIASIWFIQYENFDVHPNWWFIVIYGFPNSWNVGRSPLYRHIHCFGFDLFRTTVFSADCLWFAAANREKRYWIWIYGSRNLQSAAIFPLFCFIDRVGPKKLKVDCVSRLRVENS